MIRLTLVVLCALCVFSVLSTAQGNKNCRDCPPPSACGTKDSVMKVTFRDHTVLDDCISAIRTTIMILDRPEQAIKLTFLRKGACFDTTVAVESIESFNIVGLGLNGQPCNLVVLPAREFVRSAAPPKEPHSFLEVTGTVAYAGSDTSARSIGSSTIVPGLEVDFAPFGAFLGDKLSLALQGGLMLESGRLRFPLGGQLRLSFSGATKVKTVSGYKPNPCSFNTGSIVSPSSEDFTELPSQGERDSSSYFFLDKQLVVPTWRPFAFVEGGTFFNGGFDGAGKSPALNESDYGQYYLGGGIGTPLWSWATISLAYRYMQLNVRTPCPYCPPPSSEEFFVVNTAKVHSIMLKFGLRWDW